MTNIDFYILSATDRQARLNFACRLIEKTYRLGNRIFVACNDETEMTELDSLLWSFNPESFIPHTLLNSNQNESVEIGSTHDCGDHHQLLINLSNQIPAYFSRFERMCEIVIQDEAILKRTRKNWAFFKQRGYPVASHKL